MPFRPFDFVLCPLSRIEVATPILRQYVKDLREEADLAEVEADRRDALAAPPKPDKPIDINVDDDDDDWYDSDLDEEDDDDE